MAGCQVAYYLVHSLSDADFERKDAAAAAAFGEAGGAGRAAANHLPRRARRRQGRPVGTPAQPPRGREAARIGWCPGDRHPGRDHRRARRHFLGADPPARRPPARHDHSEMGRDPHPADRRQRRRALPARGAGPAAGGGPGPRGRGTRGAAVRHHAAPRRRYPGPARSRSCPCRCSPPGCPPCG